MVHASGGSPQLKDTGYGALEMPNVPVNSPSLRLSCSWKCHGMYPNPSKADHLHPGNHEKVDRRSREGYGSNIDFDLQMQIFRT